MPRPSIGKKKFPKADFAVPRAVLEIWRFAGTDDNRHNIHAIHFEPETVGKSKVTTIHAVTTDGHRMLHASWAAKEGDSINGIVNVSSEEVKEFLKYAGKIKKGENPPTFRLRADGCRHDNKDLAEYFLETDRRKSTPVSMGEQIEFPQWRHVLPRPPTDEMNEFSHKFGINIDYLIEFGRYLNTCDAGYAAVVHYSDKDALGPVRFTPGGLIEEGAVDVEYVLMPVRT